MTTQGKNEAIHVKRKRTFRKRFLLMILFPPYLPLLFFYKRIHSIFSVLIKTTMSNQRQIKRLLQEDAASTRRSLAIKTAFLRETPNHVLITAYNKRIFSYWMYLLCAVIFLFLSVYWLTTQGLMFTSIICVWIAGLLLIMALLMRHKMLMYRHKQAIRVKTLLLLLYRQPRYLFCWYI